MHESLAAEIAVMLEGSACWRVGHHVCARAAAAGHAWHRTAVRLSIGPFTTEQHIRTAVGMKEICGAGWTGGPAGRQRLRGV